MLEDLAVGQGDGVEDGLGALAASPFEDDDELEDVEEPLPEAGGEDEGGHHLERSSPIWTTCWPGGSHRDAVARVREVGDDADDAVVGPVVSGEPVELGPLVDGDRGEADLDRVGDDVLP